MPPVGFRRIRTTVPANSDTGLGIRTAPAARLRIQPTGDSSGSRPMAVVALKQKPLLKTFHATVHVTRVEQWCVEAETAEETRELLRVPVIDARSVTA